MSQIKVSRKIDAVNPVMVAGWPGMGNVALGAVDYLRRKLKAVDFAEIELDRYTSLDSVIVSNGLASLPNPPKNIFYFSKNPEMIIFEGEAQIPGREGIDVLTNILEMAAQLRVKMIFTGAAFPLPVSHKEPIKIYGATNKKALAGNFSKFGIMAMEDGHISGLNGLALGFAEKKGIDALCLLATIPQYAISLPNPKASWAIVEMLGRMIGFEVNPAEITEYIKDMDEKMAIIEDRVKDVFTIEKEEPESFPTEKKVPSYIMEKIEKLFLEAKKDKSKAIILKKELDRWDLYKLYEDRFLDLFKESQ